MRYLGSLFLSVILAALIVINLSFKAHKHITRHDLIIDTNVLVVTTSKAIFYKKGTHDYLQIPVTLTNNTDTTLVYWDMSCAWQQIYLIKSKMLVPDTVSTHCKENIPVTFKLEPNESKTVTLIFQLVDGYKLPIKYKVGINIIKEGKPGFDFLFGRHYDPFIVWSKKVTWNNKP